MEEVDGREEDGEEDDGPEGAEGTEENAEEGTAEEELFHEGGWDGRDEGFFQVGSPIRAVVPVEPTHGDEDEAHAEEESGGEEEAGDELQPAEARVAESLALGAGDGVGGEVE